MSLSRQIEEKINIVDIVNKYITIKKAGSNYKALCPFHNEKTPSFLISPTKNIAYCFSCHNGGGPIKFLSEIEKISYQEAAFKLAKEVGIELKTDYYKERQDNSNNIYDIYKITAEFYNKELLNEKNLDKLNYLIDRGINLETITKFNLGFASDSKKLFDYLKSKGFNEKDILESGIFVSNFKDKFLGRIIFPISNLTGHIIAFTGRVLDHSLPKYLNSPSSKIFDKSSTLFGLNLAKQEITKKDFVIIVEGQMDTISLHQAGFINTVAISGTALTESQIKLLKRFTKNIYLCLDNDDAGINATFLSLENLINEEVNIKIINLGNFKDPDEVLKSKEDFNIFLKNSLTQIDFYIKQGNKKYNLNSIQGKKSIINDMLKILKKINSKIELDFYLKEIGKNLDISLNVLYDEFNKFSYQKESNENIINHKIGFSFDEILIGYLLLYNFFDLFFKKFDYTIDDIIQINLFQNLYKILLEKDLFFEDDNVDVDKIKSIELFIEEENLNLNKEKIEKKFIDLVNVLNKKIYEKLKMDLSNQIKNNPSDINLIQKYNLLIKKNK